MTAARKREIHLNLNILNVGVYGSAWRWPSVDPAAFVDPAHYIRCAQIAEKGKLDAVFMADKPGLVDHPQYRPFQALDPLVVLSGIAATTSHIGLIGTASSSYNSPYNIARRFASLDLLSGGRAAWNIVTSAEIEIARNFGRSDVTAHADRYAIAREFVEIVRALWDSWEDEALIADKAQGLLLDISKIHPIDHQSKNFSVAGPLTLPRSPQGRPVLVQAGASDDGRNLAAGVAEVIFTLSQTLEKSIDFAADIRRRAASFGRVPEDVVILPGLCTVIGDTEAAAQARRRELEELVPAEYGLARLAGTLQVDPDLLKLDEHLPEDLPIPVNHNQTMFAGTVAIARRENLTVRQLIRRLGGGAGHRIVAGTPEQIADDIGTWFAAGAADGFNIMPDVLPEGAETFVTEVVPILQRRGLFRTEYEGSTLRDHLGLTRAERGRFSTAI
ncbi:LLM class flavin-dependent oxidoreductase [Celeribacter indicus]|uniref:Monooxygenase n=1 Tax=Celeribacter indicus TaxID=1208324 RepID=A0A0B5DZ98_9RHOB|nr:LLM class flavin-dependent oxidoreductase [Celeribacter indicus]AJE48753.1 monooxygenase [Celeribacter indicus]SDX11407.1 FMN-dependent oxidoreductase, nitrilotriacetate monooxygenase family [Celeribacter indicus]